MHRITAQALACTALALTSLHTQAAPELSTQVIASGLEHPWALTFLPDGRYLVTERPGRMRVVESNGRLNAALKGLPAIAAAGQGGLLDLVLDSDFASNRQLYFCFSEPGQGADRGKNSTAMAKARLSADAGSLENVQIIFSQHPKVDSALHFGCRIVERKVNGKPDGSLFLTLGERYKAMQEAQNLQTHLGKIVRINKDGSLPRDNPFIDNAAAQPEIWSYGHRNSQGAALGPNDELWMTEHGPQGGDELNRIAPGKNYGWPVITYGENYGGGKIGAGITEKAGMEQPQHYWVPSIAPSGLAYLSSARYGVAWQGSFITGALKAMQLQRISVANGKVTSTQVLLPRLGQRVRDVRQGPDGLLYLLTDAADGQILRVLPRP